MNLMKKIRCMNVAGIREWVRKGTPLQDVLCFYNILLPVNIMCPFNASCM